jgi:hypothetical protein
MASIDQVNGVVKKFADDSNNKLSQVKSSYQVLAERVQKENDIINKTYKNFKNINSANGQQSIYVKQSSQSLALIGTIVFWTYMVLAVILCFIIYQKPFSIVTKISLMVLVVIFPFYIYPLEQLTYMISTYLSNVVASIVYINNYEI